MDDTTSGEHARGDEYGGEAPNGGGTGNGGGKPPIPSDPDFVGPWVHRVVFAAKPGGGTFAFRPGQVLTTRGQEALGALQGLGNTTARFDRTVREFTRLLDVGDTLEAVAQLRRRGFVAEPNFVFFAHAGCNCGCGGGWGGCGQHPSGTWGSSAQSVHPTPVAATSVHPTPFFVTSVHPTPHGGCGCGCGCGCGGRTSSQSVHPTPHQAATTDTVAARWPLSSASVHPTPYGPTSVHPTPAGGCGCCPGWGFQSVHPTPVGATSVHPTPNPLAPRRSSARPAPPNTDTSTIKKDLGMPPMQNGPKVIVVDTGLATGSQFPPAMATAPVTPHHPQSDLDFADVTVPPDDLLDEVAGHGTFIAGLIEQVASGCAVELHKVLAPVGDTDTMKIVDCLESLVLDKPKRTVLSLSFGGYVPDLPLLLAGAIAAIQAKGVVVVASAGNDGSCEPMYPAALPGVVSVGAIGPDGPASFTNYGPWVRACAPGVDLLSTFFVFSGATPPTGSGPDPDDFKGWALWSGTSFSAPLVAGALARTMWAEDCDGVDAVARIIDNPSLLRIPDLGTVVNVI